MPLTHYAYDPLDRLTTTSVGAPPSTQRFYNHERLSTTCQGEHSHSVFQHHNLLLAEKHTSETLLLGTDLQRSVLHSLSGAHKHPRAYSPYGHHRVQSEQQSLLGFNGEAPDPITGHYLLGNGHRAYNPVLMRFNSPDTLSPFGKGGINPYAYCSGDPVNRSDPNGRFWGVNVKTLISSFMGLFSVAVSTVPSLGFKESVIAIKRRTHTLDHVVKVGTTSAAFIGASTSTARNSLLDPGGGVGEALHWISTTATGVSLAGSAFMAARDVLRRRALRNQETIPDVELQNGFSTRSYTLQRLSTTTTSTTTTTTTTTTQTERYLRSQNPLAAAHDLRTHIRNAP